MKYVEESIPVTIGQILYEYKFLGEKILNRTGVWEGKSINKFERYQAAMITNLFIFYVTDGDVESWEKVK